MWVFYVSVAAQKRICICLELPLFWVPLNVPQLDKDTSGREFIQLLNRRVLGLVSPVNFPSMSVGFMQNTYLHTYKMQYKQSHKRNQQGKGDCYSRIVVVGCSVSSEVPAVCCPCFGCYSAKKAKYFIVVWVPLPTLPYMLLHSNGQIQNCFVGGAKKRLCRSVLLRFTYFRWSICFLFFTL